MNDLLKFCIVFGVILIGSNNTSATENEEISSDSEVASHADDSISRISTVMSDSIWYDNITGVKTHLQRVGNKDFNTPNCVLHFFGKDKDGETTMPALQALTEDLGINALVLSWDYFIQNRSWARISKNVLHDNLTDKWVWDNDSFSGNQFSHPYHGGMFYNAAREHGLSYGVSLLYPLAGSLTWELFCETNRPAFNDFLSTGIGGAAIGEITHRTSDIFFDNSKRGATRVAREVVGTLLNPVRGLHRILSGEAFHVNRLSAGKVESPEPYTFQVGVGNRYIADYGNIHPASGQRINTNIPFFDVRFTYGNHFNNLNEGCKPRAFDYFDLYALVNMASGQPTIGEFEIKGRIGSIQRELSHQWMLDIGFYQYMKLSDHYTTQDNQNAGNMTLLTEAASFGGGFHAERQGKKVSLLNDFEFAAVPLGGCNADYYPARRYNFGTGFSIRHNFQFILNRHLSFGNKLYIMRLFTIKGFTPEKLAEIYNGSEEHATDLADGISAWGDKGENSIITNDTYLHLNVTKDVTFNINSRLYLRHGNYRYYPSVTSKSYELWAGFKFGI